MLDADRVDHALLDQADAQLGQRPLVHADPLLGWAQHEFDDPLDDVGEELARLTRAIGVEGVPADPVDALGVEAVDDAAHPLRRAVAQRRDLAVARAAARKQDDSGVAAIDLVGELAFHPVQHSPFPRCEPPCSHTIHGGSPLRTIRRSVARWRTSVPAIDPSRNLVIAKLLRATDANAKLVNWKGH